MKLVAVVGTVAEIIYRNEKNGYTVLSLETDNDLITIVGYMPVINMGETIKVEGEWTFHSIYGEQLKISNISTVVPSTLNGIEKYLSSGLIPNMGVKTAKKVIEKFGLDSLDIIQYNPERLKEIEGIGDKKLKKIVEAFEEQKDMRDIMVFLQQYGITISYGIRIYKKWGKDTVKIISENPYRLSEDIFGIGFKTADKIAQNMGVEKNSPYRVMAGIKYKIMEFAGKGHSYVPENELVLEVSAMLDIEINEVEEGVRDLALKGDLHLENSGMETLVYYTPFYKAEFNVSKKILELSRVKLPQLNLNIEEDIERIEKDEGIHFALKQKEAIKESAENGLLVITGGPGTGKTTTINAIIKIFEEKDMKVILAAPTGRAAKRMSNATGKDAKTIHRLLEYSFLEEDMAFSKNEEDPIEGDLIIIDEASMVDILLMNSLMKAIAPGTRLILLGDVDQLPSVGPGNVLKDIINSGIVKVVQLNEIFRQAEESMIIVNAHKINRGENPVLNVKDKDFFFIHKKTPREISDIILDLCSYRIPDFDGYDKVKDIQVLSPMKKGEVGINSLNQKLQNILNPKGKGKQEKQVGEEIFRVGDKVMQIKNNYRIEWKTAQGEEGEGIFNGDLGIIDDIDEEEKKLKVLFDDERKVEYDFNEIDELKLAYAITVHKSQGSEFPVVIIPICWGPPMLLTRNLLYTAITRAKKLVVLVGEEKYLYMMINNNRIDKRYSGLDSRIRNMMTII